LAVVRTEPRFFYQKRKAPYFQIIFSDKIASLVPGLTCFFNYTHPRRGNKLDRNISALISVL